MTVRDFMSGIDARIYSSQIVRAVADFGVVSGVIGAFFLGPREVNLPGGNVQAVELSFECTYFEELATMQVGALVEVDDYGRYRFLRELCPGGDESGQTVIELGELVE